MASRRLRQKAADFLVRHHRTIRAPQRVTLANEHSVAALRRLQPRVRDERRVEISASAAHCDADASDDVQYRAINRPDPATTHTRSSWEQPNQIVCSNHATSRSRGTTASRMWTNRKKETKKHRQCQRRCFFVLLAVTDREMRVTLQVDRAFGVSHEVASNNTPAPKRQTSMMLCLHFSVVPTVGHDELLESLLSFVLRTMNRRFICPQR